DTPDPPGGRIERGPGGEPSGVLREEAMALVESLLPENSQEELMEGARRALKMAAGFGLTALHEAAADEKTLAAYAELERRGELTARVDASFQLDPSSGVPDLEALRARHQGKLLRLTGGKIFADGVLEARTGAVLEPYVGRGGLGTALWDQKAFDEAASELDRRGCQVHVHAVGDRAVRMALDAVAEARRRNGPGGPTHEIVHLELIDPSDLPRFKALRVAAGFQPLWAWRDPYITDLTEPVLGPERSARLYPLGSALRAGALLACGSDWSVSSMNPWEAIQVGATRRGLEEGPGQAWLPGETLPLDELLRCYTTGGALAGGLDAGALEPGKPADFIVLDRDPYRTPLHQLKAVKVLETYLEGRRVYSE
ncbi:MAG TPA: amidohydrolase, partial [Elusimicrobia bacterium]|nr:amidohydrolase [Elusimicrobiota bacterium]